jgi:AraC family transcriptional regulator
LPGASVPASPARKSRATVYTIRNKWLAESGHDTADAPNFERYGENFDPRSGTGGVEIWLPLKT